MADSSEITFRINGEVVFTKQMNRIVDYGEVSYDIAWKYESEESEVKQALNHSLIPFNKGKYRTR